MLVTKFSNGKYRNEGERFAEPISDENVKLMGEMMALQHCARQKSSIGRSQRGIISDSSKTCAIWAKQVISYRTATTLPRPRSVFSVNSRAREYPTFTAKTAEEKRSRSSSLVIVNWTTYLGATAGGLKRQMR